MDDSRRLLEATGLFDGVNEESYAELMSFSSWCWLANKEVLYRQGDPPEFIFVLAEGSVKLVHRCGGTREHVVRLVTSGEVFAESALFSADEYETNAIALEDSRLLAISARPFVECLRRRPDLAWNVLVRFAKRIDQLVTQTELLATHSAEQKVAAYLLGKYRAAPVGAAAVQSTCRRSDLASMLALAPETLCRIVTEFKRRNWIRSEHGDILVIDAEALDQVVPQ
jgi:CRP/FNR family transcriptional regulator